MNEDLPVCYNIRDIGVLYPSGLAMDETMDNPGFAGNSATRAKRTRTDMSAHQEKSGK